MQKQQINPSWNRVCRKDSLPVKSKGSTKLDFHKKWQIFWRGIISTIYVCLLMASYWAAADLNICGRHSPIDPGQSEHLHSSNGARYLNLLCPDRVLHQDRQLLRWPQDFQPGWRKRSQQNRISAVLRMPFITLPVTGWERPAGGLWKIIRIINDQAVKLNKSGLPK